MHPCEDDLVCRGTNEKIPYFNAPLYLENKAQIGKVDDIFGAFNEYVSTAQSPITLYAVCTARDYAVCVCVPVCTLPLGPKIIKNGVCWPFCNCIIMLPKYAISTLCAILDI